MTTIARRSRLVVRGDSTAINGGLPSAYLVVACYSHSVWVPHTERDPDHSYCSASLPREQLHVIYASLRPRPRYGTGIAEVKVRPPIFELGSLASSPFLDLGRHTYPAAEHSLRTGRPLSHNHSYYPHLDLTFVLHAMRYQLVRHMNVPSLVVIGQYHVHNHAYL